MGYIPPRVQYQMKVSRCKCGYDLHDHTLEDRCPECGLHVTGTLAAEALQMLKLRDRITFIRSVMFIIAVCALVAIVYSVAGDAILKTITQ